MPNKLKPCPFCGEVPVGTVRIGCIFYVRCLNCGSNAGCKTRVEEAIELWNRRINNASKN